MSHIHQINTPRLYEPSKPERDPQYLNFIRSIGWCLACGRQCKRWSGRGPRAEAMHTGPHGIGQKSSDYSALPGCRDCHRELHKLGPVLFQEKWGLVFADHIRRLNERYFRTRKRAA